MKALIHRQRELYHQALIKEGVLSVDSHGIPSNADKSSRISIELSRIMSELLFANSGEKIQGQTSGAKFEQINLEFIKNTFPTMANLRPGKWVVEKLGNRNVMKTSSFVQYEHLAYLSELTKNDATLATVLGNDYIIAPDIVVYRMPESDAEINVSQILVDGECACQSMLRQCVSPLPILHASISAKWTMRSDRAQNSRTEALGLIRNRKGHLPHISVITGEPLPSRLASLALGTGDIDCLYHFALYELLTAVEKCGCEDAQEMLDILIKGKRLKDISDLPLDLCV